MIKKILIFCSILFGGQTGFAQILNQDASGKSSILVQGSAVNIDIAETQAQITYNGSFGTAKGTTGKYTKGILGFDLRAKNKTGVANLFSNGKFSPDGTLSGVIGFRTTRYVYPDNSVADKDALMEKYVQLRELFGTHYAAQVTAIVAASSLKAVNKIIVDKELKDLTKKRLAKLSENLTVFKSSITAPDEVNIIVGIVKTLQGWVVTHLDEINTLNNMATALNQSHVSALIQNTTIYHYLRIGINTIQFTYDKGNAAANYDSRFMDTVSTSFFVEYGYTKQYRMNFVGVNIGYFRLSNIESLTTADYTYNYQDTSLKSGMLTKQQSFKGYSGAYGFYNKIYLNIDFQHLFTLDESKYLAIGPYLRYNNVFNAKDIAKNNTVLGISMNYLDGKMGKFLGGIYIQSDDIAGTKEPKFKKTIKFGLIAKFNLSSIFLFQ